jgi:hypothetical protein
MTDPFEAAIAAGLEICGSLATSERHLGQPVLVGHLLGTVLFPPLPLVDGLPVVELIVSWQGVTVASGLWAEDRRARRALTATAIPFARINGVPCVRGFSEAVWREAVDCALTAALAGLPTGRARTGP